ncbi:hypothetical protein TanjilG_28226 [Lupinus angustifolius]|uniref:Uncharacterized protein n=1 Tax=Lupinus angustifolius TaxID=3871 RepID=A0A4P1REZ1_LUPAN|nr:PREDICTED: uncharacterized protein LOC109350900 [Lupinus angustifolius]OIW09627.1 hypothetical protein TanjilG_28226 [Lupinus angustifolius]
MENNIVEDFITKMQQPLSPNDDDHKSNDMIIDDMNQKVDSVVAETEVGDEGLEQHDSFIHVAESDDLVQPIIEMSNVKNQNEGLAESGVVSHKRKLSQVADEGGEKVSENQSLLNDPEAQEKDIANDDAKRTKLDLNIPIIDEDDDGSVYLEEYGIVDSPNTLGIQQTPQGGEMDDEVVGIVYSPPVAAIGFQVAPQGEELDKKVEENEDLPATPLSLGLKLEPQGLKVVDSPYGFGAQESEAGSSNLNKNDAGSSKAHHIYDFDLNVPLTDEDEDEAEDF